MTKLTPIEHLRHLPYLRTLPETDVRALATATRVVRLVRGDVLFREGDDAEGIFYIASGRVRVVRASADGREQVLHEEGPGVTLAEVPVFDGGGCVGTAIATEDSELLLVPRSALLDALARNPANAGVVITVLAARVRKLAVLAADLSLKPVLERVAAYVVREGERRGSLDVRLPETRDELAAHVGTVREQASRALSQLSRAGVIEVHGRKVVIVDLDRLRALAALDDDNQVPH